MPSSGVPECRLSCDLVPQVRQRVRVAVLVRSEGGASGGEQVGRIQAGEGGELVEPVDLGEQERDGGQGGPDGERGGAVERDAQVGPGGLRVEGRSWGGRVGGHVVVSASFRSGLLLDSAASCRRSWV